jgi:hypothetical protein
MTLPTAGAYTFAITPTGTTAVGSITVQLQNAPTATGTATIGGAAVTLATTVPAQQSQLTFTTTSAYQTVTFVFSGITYPSGDCSYDAATLVGPAPGNPTLATSTLCGLSSVYGTFPAAGTYTITLVPYATDTGSITYQLH